MYFCTRVNYPRKQPRNIATNDNITADSSVYSFVGATQHRCRQRSCELARCETSGGRRCVRASERASGHCVARTEGAQLKRLRGTLRESREFFGQSRVVQVDAMHSERWLQTCTNTTDRSGPLRAWSDAIVSSVTSSTKRHGHFDYRREDKIGVPGTVETLTILKTARRGYYRELLSRM